MGLFAAIRPFFARGASKSGLTFPSIAAQDERADAKKLKVKGTVGVKMSDFDIPPPAPKVALGAIKTAKFYGLGSQETVVTICTDAIDRYYSVMAAMTECYGRMDETEAAVRVESIFHGQKTDWIREGTQHARACWHNLKYYTWVEQQGKTVQELDAQKDPAWWLEHQALVADIDARIFAARG